jgi:hypothetical protein
VFRINNRLITDTRNDVFGSNFVVNLSGHLTTLYTAFMAQYCISDWKQANRGRRQVECDSGHWDESVVAAKGEERAAGA